MQQTVAYWREQSEIADRRAVAGTLVGFSLGVLLTVVTQYLAQWMWPVRMVP